MKGGRNFRRCPARWSRRSMTLPPKGAFSAIELLVTVGIILVLVTVYWGGGAPNRKAQQRSNCLKNLQTTSISLQTYANDFGTRFPYIPQAKTSEEPLDLLVPKYTSDTSIFTCPASRDSALPAGESFLNRKISYAYYMGRRSTDSPEVLMTDRQVDSSSKAAGQLMFSDTGKPPGNNHKKAGGNLLFSDGRAESSPPLAAFSIVLTQGVVLLNPKH